jgi:hypothetical protein
MPFNETITAAREALPKPEILSYPLETNVIDSVVLKATGVTADSSGPYAGRRYLLAGTILSKRGDGLYERYTAAGGQAVAGILFDTVEFASNADTSNEPAAMLRKSVSFDKTKIVDFVTFQADLETFGEAHDCEFI